MYGPPYLLASKVPSTVAGAGKAAAIQDVFMTTQSGSACEWKCVPVDGDELAANGVPIVAGAPVVILHCVTNQALSAVAGDVAANDFGPELKVTCITHKPASLAAPDRRRAALEPNKWSFVLASDPSAAVETRDLKPLTAEALLDKVRGIINERGHFGIRGLGVSFRIMDDTGAGKLSREDFKWGLADYGVTLSDEEFDMVLNAFDRNHDGVIDFSEFLITLRGPISPRRIELINQAFSRLDKDGSGSVTLSDLVTVYNTRFDPEVISGSKTHEQAVAEFMSQWDTIDKDGVVTLEEFQEYYKDVSASVDDDDYFELMMRNAWHISGGAGAMENTTCRRVLVVHTDGGEEVVELKSDLGVKAGDLAEIRRRLTAQGVKDISRIELK